MGVRRRLYRLRLLNASNAREYRLVLGGRRPMLQIGSDGGLLERPLKRRVVTLSPAERVDVVVDFRDYAPGTELVLHNELGNGSTVAVMRFDVERGGGAEEARVPSRLRELGALPAPAVDRRFELTLATASGIAWQIGGRSFDRTGSTHGPGSALGALDFANAPPGAPHAHPGFCSGCLAIRRSGAARTRVEGHGALAWGVFTVQRGSRRTLAERVPHTARARRLRICCRGGRAVSSARALALAPPRRLHANDFPCVAPATVKTMSGTR